MGPGEMMLVLVLALIVFGPGKLPEIARGMGRAVREFQKATSQITEELTRELQTDTPAQEAPQPQAPVPAPQAPASQEPLPDVPVAAAEPQNGPLVLEIKRPATNGAAASRAEIPPAVQTAPVEAPVAEAPVADAPVVTEATTLVAAPKPARPPRARKPKAEPVSETEAAAVVAPPTETAPEVAAPSDAVSPARPRRRRKVAEVTEPVQD